MTDEFPLSFFSVFRKEDFFGEVGIHCREDEEEDNTEVGGDDDDDDDDGSIIPEAACQPSIHVQEGGVLQLETLQPCRGLSESPLTFIDFGIFRISGMVSVTGCTDVLFQDTRAPAAVDGSEEGNHEISFHRMAEGTEKGNHLFQIRPSEERRAAVIWDASSHLHHVRDDRHRPTRLRLRNLEVVEDFGVSMNCREEFNALKLDGLGV